MEYKNVLTVCPYCGTGCGREGEGKGWSCRQIGPGLVPQHLLDILSD